MKLEKIENQTLAIVEDKENFRQLHVALHHYGADDSTLALEVCHLWLVTTRRHNPGEHPVVSHFYVMAQDEKNAIEQVDGNAFPELSHPFEECKTLECSAIQIPFQIRGWGRQVF